MAQGCRSGYMHISFPLVAPVFAVGAVDSPRRCVPVHHPCLSHHTFPDVLLPQRVFLLSYISDLKGKTKKNAEKVQKKVEEKREKIKKYERQKLAIEERKSQIENRQVRTSMNLSSSTLFGRCLVAESRE